MADDMYFLIHNSDGDTHVEVLNRTQMARRLNEDMEDGADEEGDLGDIYFDAMPDEADTNYWNGSTLIIKGRVVAPKVVSRATTYEID